MAKRLIVIGAGPMGLAAAYYAAKRGLEVEVIEADDRPGGMAAHFDFEGLSIERFYHFCCLSDADTLALMGELGIADKMKWVATSMGYFVDGQLYKWGEPFSLLFFPKLDLISKIRYGLQMFTATKRSDWRKLDGIAATQWFKDWAGARAYDVLWRRLMELKFHDYADRVSAAWMWQRIKRLGNSRASLFEERLGYIDGGSAALIEALVTAITAMGGKIHLSSPARRILIAEGRVRGVETREGRQIMADEVISTIPTPYVPALLEGAENDLLAPYRRIENIGCVCVVLKLKRSVSSHFWVNISDKRVAVPGLVEFSNLRPLPHAIVYVPFYMPPSHPKFGRADEDFIADSLLAIRLVNPDIGADDLIGAHVGRLRHAQPVCETGFAALIPPAQTSIKGLQIADTCFYYPEDRGVSESIKFAKGMVERAALRAQA
ncbi:MAG: NAD(P)/FAD-dependent oxidoreductase [Alphaproteobacteria bacterium]|nr:NAD(P)/FAD-dependent oxidoreductase [Alphaproteobacteria bacterium]